MKSSFWVLGGVTLLCLGIVRCSRHLLDNDENFLDKTTDGDEERTFKDEDAKWALHKARNSWNEISQFSSLQRSEENGCTDDSSCFSGATCSDGICGCKKDEQYFYEKACKDLSLNCKLNSLKTTCDCPEGTTRSDVGEECAPDDDKKCNNKECGYGVCVKEGEEEQEVETCKCFTGVAVNDGDTCKLKTDFCASGERQEEDSTKCKCEGKFKQANDGITCVLKPCKDEEAINDCTDKERVCTMDWKGTGYDCKCPQGFKEDGGGNCEKDLCYGITCYNGHCLQEKGECECDTGYSGDQCENLSEDKCNEEIPECASTQGTCKSVGTKENVQCICAKDLKFVKSEGCKDLCKDITCYNGRCNPENGKCKCDTGYNGDQCENLSEDKCEEKIPECASTKGTCKSVGTKENVQCICAKDLTFVESEGCKDLCEGVTCFKGECVQKTGKCNCTEGYTGTECEILSDEECGKQLQLCHGTDGTCKIVNAEGTPVCQCPGSKTFDGTKGCPNICEGVTCFNGECDKKTGECHCTQGYSGKKCEILPKTKCEEELEICAKTNGTCISVDETNFECKCKTGYSFVNDQGCLSYKDIEAMNCKEVCGETDGVTCGGNKRNITLIKCTCKKAGEAFHEEDKECKTDYCKKKCGTASTVICSGNMFIEEEVQCNCRIDYQDFDEENKKCKINYCKKVCGTDDEVNCEDEENRYTKTNPKCSCHDSNKAFVNKKCIQKCNDDNPCENEGTCKGVEGSKTCECNRGTAGDLCDKVVECEKGGKYEKCKDGKGDCKFKGGKPLCECTEENHKLYEDGGYCDVQCENDEKCDGNRVCNKKKFCVCKTGYEGDDCDVVSGCKTLEKECKDIGKECEYDPNVPSLLATCKCEDNLKYYRTKKECLPKCKSKKCEGNRACNEDDFCLCKAGFEGEDCTTVTGCKGDLGEKCKELEVDCIFDENSKVKATCNCTKGFKYDPDEKKCQPEYCYPVDPCKKAKVKCVFDETTGVGYCQCQENQFFSHETELCKDFADKCLLRKTPCDENYKCQPTTGKCICKYKQEKDGECKRQFCDPNPCFKGANCSEADGSCFCDVGKYYKGKECIKSECNLKEYRATCKCPDNKKRENGECVIDEKDKCEKKTHEECGYGICVKKNKIDTCVCFTSIAKNIGGKCVLKSSAICASDKLEEDKMKCKCEGKYKQADDGITCILKTCDDDDVKKECETNGGKCVMEWKGNNIGYDCKCPESYEKDSTGKCTDPCSIEKYIKECTDNGQVCYNYFSTKNSKTYQCQCPPTVEKVNGNCVGKAANAYLYKKILVLKKKYELDSGINKVLLNKHLVESLQQTFKSNSKEKDIYDFGYLYDYNVEGSIVNCSVWVNFKRAPTETELKKVKAAGRPFSKVCDDCDDNVMIWPPNLFLSDTGSKEAVAEQQDFCKVKDRLCGKGAKCTEDKDKNGKCSCDDGYQMVQYGVLKIGPHEVQVCEDINECALGIDKCPGNTKCFNTIGNYSCVCKDGFKKRSPPDDPESDKSNCVDLCTPSPCNKGKCVLREKEKTFDCECEPGVGGSFCHRADENYKSAKKSTVVVGAVLGSILAVGAIAVLYYIIKKKKRYGSEDFMPAPRMDHAEMTERRHVRGVTNKAYE